MKNSIYLSNQQFKKIKDQAVVIDVRTKQERIILPRIKNDIHCYYQKLIDNCQIMFSDKTVCIITYCNSGNRSSIAAQALSNCGYCNVFVLEHGVFGWNRYLLKHSS